MVGVLIRLLRDTHDGMRRIGGKGTAPVREGRDSYNEIQKGKMKSRYKSCQRKQGVIIHQCSRKRTMKEGRLKGALLLKCKTPGMWHRSYHQKALHVHEEM